MSTPDRLTTALADRYRIERELGAGGMATVYLAEDLKHDRKVAIKVLKPELAAVLGAERFVQEIKTTAALSHPHILPLFDSGEAGRDMSRPYIYYVMPYIKGETIREKLDRETQFGIDEAVRITTEVADALDYAHRNGVIHRDIKPENILLHDGRAMVMDFGIALAVSAAAGGRMTETGLSLGTPHYMSPEQATADKDITARSDEYSLASVLFEMLTGDPPHVGSSAQQIIMKIVTDEAAPVTKLRKSVPPNVAAAVSKALEKLPADRFESAKAFANALTDPGYRHGNETTAVASARTPWYRHVPTLSLVAGVAGLGLALLTVAVQGRKGKDEAQPVIRFALSADPAVHVDTRTTRPFAVSPDGRAVVFRASTDSTPARLWVRHLGEAEAHPLTGTEGGWNPAISPDGTWVAFITDGHHIQKVRLGGGDVSTVAAFDVNSAALSWASDDEILFEALVGTGAGAVGIQRVSAVGGPPALAVPLDSAAGEIQQRRPFALRDAGVVVYGSSVRSESQATLVAYRLSDGRRTRLGIPGIGALAFVDGYLIYSLADGTLMAVPFDPSSMRLGGAPVELLPRVASNGGIGTAVGLSESGTLVYRGADASATAHLELVDTTGQTTPVKGDFSVVQLPRFSPDGRRIAVVSGRASSARDPGPSGDLWVVDATTGVSTRVNTDGSVGYLSWFPDGRRVAFIAGATGSSATYRGSEIRSVAVDGSAPPSSLLQTHESAACLDVAPDGRSLVVAGFVEQGATLLRHWVDDSRVDTLLMGAEQGGRVTPWDPRVSPDGRWVAFVESFSSEVWVRSMDGHTLLQVSSSPTNATPVVWGPDSRHLYYVGTEGLVDIELRLSPTLGVVGRHTIPAVLSGARLYDLSPDGRTFVVARTPSRTDDVLVVVGWLDQARKAWQGNAAP